MLKKILEKLNFVNKFSTLPNNFYQKVILTIFQNAYFVDYNKNIAKILEIDELELSDKLLKYFCKGEILHGSNPISTIYGGHQFGHWAGQLGDGRAILFGEIQTSNSAYEINLKGSGQTPYSRGFDGRAVLRSSIREYLVSHATYILNIPTTHALCLFGTGEIVKREKFEKGALVVRIAKSFIRFGSFELFYYNEQYDQVKILTDFVIENYYSEFADKPNKYILFFKEVVIRTAKLIAKWMSVGFTHGVMNTDNMSIIGLTIDYGPYGFMDKFDFNFVPNHSDSSGRYSYKNQPYIGFWNLKALLVSLSKIIDYKDGLIILEKYQDIYRDKYTSLMRKKLGLKKALDIDSEIVDNLLHLMNKYEVDYTIFFRKLSNENYYNDIRKMFGDAQEFRDWFVNYQERLKLEINPLREKQMNKVNPKFILRNYMLEIAIYKAEQDDYSEIKSLKNLLSEPYREQIRNERYASPSPDWAENIIISCSS